MRKKFKVLDIFDLLSGIFRLAALLLGEGDTGTSSESLMTMISLMSSSSLTRFDAEGGQGRASDLQFGDACER
jgi:hypothetical protein